MHASSMQIQGSAMLHSLIEVFAETEGEGEKMSKKQKKYSTFIS